MPATRIAICTILAVAVLFDASMSRLEGAESRVSERSILGPSKIWLNQDILEINKISQIGPKWSGLFIKLNPDYPIQLERHSNGVGEYRSAKSCLTLFEAFDAGFVWPKKPIYPDRDSSIADTGNQSSFQSWAGRCQAWHWLRSAQRSSMTTFSKAIFDTPDLADKIPIGLLLPGCLLEKLYGQKTDPTASASSQGFTFEPIPKNPVTWAEFRKSTGTGPNFTEYTVLLRIVARAALGDDGWDDLIINPSITLWRPLAPDGERTMFGFHDVLVVVTRKDAGGPFMVRRTYSTLCDLQGGDIKTLLTNHSRGAN